jgi:membrane protein implicated in regulation of membrane protease activity
MGQASEATLDWNTSTLWWLAAGALVAAELATGTFYLLMVALGCVAGAAAAHVGLGLAPQLVLAAVLGAGATTALYLRRRRAPRAAPSESNRDVNLDIGQRVHVSHWSHEGTARVPYRGASWAVRHAGPGKPAAGEHVIVALIGSELRVAPAAAEPR